MTLLELIMTVLPRELLKLHGSFSHIHVSIELINDDVAIDDVISDDVSDDDVTGNDVTSDYLIGDGLTRCGTSG